MAELSERERKKLYVASAFGWMQNAMAGTPGKVKDMIDTANQAFIDIVEGYEEEIECLEHALHAGNDTQTSSLPAPVDSVED